MDINGPDKYFKWVIDTVITTVGQNYVTEELYLPELSLHLDSVRETEFMYRMKYLPSFEGLLPISPTNISPLFSGEKKHHKMTKMNMET